MKRLDSLIIREMAGPWAFGVGMFTVLIFAGEYLFRLTDYFVGGAPPWSVLQLSLLVLPGVVAKTFAMAVLLAGLLAFGRLSSDSEIVAIRAAGVSIGRIVSPVAGFSLLVALGAFALNELVVPRAALQAVAIQRELAKQLQGRRGEPLAQSQFENGRLVLSVGATDFNLATRTLRGVTITAYRKDGSPSFFLYTPEMRFRGENDWRIVGGGLLVPANGSAVMLLHGDAWPAGVPKMTISPQDLLTPTLKSLDAYTMADYLEQIRRARNNPHVSRKQLANLEYGFWNKLAIPLAALIYGLLGAPLGIRNVRTSAATGFALSIVIIFVYITMANLMNVYAMGGVIPPYAASFTPLLIGLAAAGVIIWRRNL